jgi:hypothetical protein
MNKFVIYVPEDAKVGKLKRYLNDKKFSFTVYRGQVVEKTGPEAEAIATYCKKTGQGRFRRSKEELALGLSVEAAIAQRLATSGTDGRER